MLINIILFIFFYISSALMVIGYGQLSKSLIISNQKNFNEIGFIGLFGFLFLYFISSIIIFFYNINNYVSSIIFLLGITLFFIFLLKKQYSKKSLIIFSCIIIIFLPLAIISEPNEDFFFYYKPYMNYLQNSKIIFGIVNLNNTLAFSTYSLYDIIIFFNISEKFENNFSIPILIFYFFYLTFLIELLLKKFNIFYFVVLFLSIVSFAKLRDMGTSIPPQLLLIIIACLIYSLLLNGFKEEIITKIFLLLVFAILLRFNSVIVIPLILLLFIYYYKFILPYLINNKKSVFFMFIVLALFFSKNIINSGCLVYPVKSLCFDNLYWSSNLKVTEQKYNKLSSDSKGWAFYAKENFQITDKFVWTNLEKENFYNYNIYLKTSPVFWSQYWIKDPNYKKILNLFLLGLFALIILNTFKRGKIYKNNIDKKNISIFFTSIFLVIVCWFLVSPQMRYGGYFCFIIFVSLIVSLFDKYINRNSHIVTLIFLIVLAVSYVNIKNIKRVYNDFGENKFINFPWPNNHKLNKNIDYITFTKDSTLYNQRLRTKKLVFDNGEQAILMCGDIDFPCIPVGKEVCLGEKTVYNSFIFYKKNTRENQCYEFMNKNILY